MSISDQPKISKLGSILQILGAFALLISMFLPEAKLSRGNLDDSIIFWGYEGIGKCNGVFGLIFLVIWVAFRNRSAPRFAIYATIVGLISSAFILLQLITFDMIGVDIDAVASIGFGF